MAMRLPLQASAVSVVGFDNVRFEGGKDLARGRRLLKIVDWWSGKSGRESVRFAGEWIANTRAVVARAEIMQEWSGGGVQSLASRGVIEVNKDTFWPIVESAGKKVVVLDMFTQWCGPCKLMYPKVVTLSDELTDTIFLKLDCNQENKPLAKELGIKVVPTFKIFKNKQLVGEVTGAKYDELVKAINAARKAT